MEKNHVRNLGKTGLKVSSLCLGAMTFGKGSGFMKNVSCESEAVAFRMMDFCMDNGINFIDTANIYNYGESETIIGKWIKDKREQVVLATKGFFKMSDDPNNRGAGRKHLKNTVNHSLKRLQTDYIDLFQIHMQDIETPIEETLIVLDELIREGKILYIGCSNYTAYRLMESLWKADKNNLHSYVSLQAYYSLLCRDIEREIIPLLQNFGLGLLVWSPLARGFLSGKYHRNTHPEKGSRLHYWKEMYTKLDTEQNWEILEVVSTIAKAHQATPAQISIAWLLSQKNVTSVIIGATTFEQLKENIESRDIVLTEQESRDLQSVSSYLPGYPYDFLKGNAGTW